MNEAILVEGIIKSLCKYLDHQNSDVGAANRKDKDGYFPENMFSTENYLNGNYIVHTGKENCKKEPTGNIEGGYTLDNGTELSPKDSLGRSVPRDPYQLQNYDPVCNWF